MPFEHPFFKYPKSLYHKIYHPVIVKTSDEEAIARTAEYQDNYVPQEFPKMVFGVTVKDADEEKHVLESKIDSRGNVQGPATPNNDAKSQGDTTNPPVKAAVDQGPGQVPTQEQPSTDGKPDSGNRPGGEVKGGAMKKETKGGGDETK